MELRDYVRLDDSSRTGLSWIKRPHARSAARPGDAAFTSTRTGGYLGGQFDSKPVLAHRVIFYLYHGYMPEIVDHWDGDTRNNAISNLRPSSASENQHNRLAKGYHRMKCGRFDAQICVGRKKRSLGYFHTEAEARAAYLAAKATQHPTASARCY